MIPLCILSNILIFFYVFQDILENTPLPPIEKRKCPVEGCDSSGHLGGLYERHFSVEACPVFHNVTKDETKVKIRLKIFYMWQVWEGLSLLCGCFSSAFQTFSTDFLCYLISIPWSCRSHALPSFLYTSRHIWKSMERLLIWFPEMDICF